MKPLGGLRRKTSFTEPDADTTGSRKNGDEITQGLDHLPKERYVRQYRVWLSKRLTGNRKKQPILISTLEDSYKTISSMVQPFIHPEIILAVKTAASIGYDEGLDSNQYHKAKKSGEDQARNIIAELFQKNEHGKIESHFNTARLNSSNFSNFREQIINLHFQREHLTMESAKVSKKHEDLESHLLKEQKSFFKFLFKKRINTLFEKVQEAKVEATSIQQVTDESYLSITFDYGADNLKTQYSNLVSAFTTLKSSEKIWDMTFSQANLETKAAAQTSMTRSEVSFSFSSLEVIETNEKTLHFQNFNGGDFYFYPSFIIYFKSKEEIAILDYSDLHLHYTESRFLEEAKNIPTDTEKIGETWYRVNKDGSPDKRFADNYKIPIVLYGSIQLKTTSGVNELYYISDAQKAKHYCEQYSKYQSLLRHH